MMAAAAAAAADATNAVPRRAPTGLTAAAFATTASSFDQTVEQTPGQHKQTTSAVAISGRLATH